MQLLISNGARFYSAWTRPACFKQMDFFGKQSWAGVTYEECREPEQLPEQAEVCNAAEIRT